MSCFRVLMAELIKKLERSIPDDGRIKYPRLGPMLEISRIWETAVEGWLERH